MEKLEWQGGKAFNERDWSSWEVNGEMAGVVKSEGPLTAMSVWGAGHMVR